MITVILWLGTALGFAIGLLHATQIVATESQDSSPDGLFTRIYRAIWAIGLWTLFGTYLLVLWLLAFILKLAFIVVISVVVALLVGYALWQLVLLLASLIPVSRSKETVQKIAFY